MDKIKEKTLESQASGNAQIPEVVNNQAQPINRTKGHLLEILFDDFDNKDAICGWIF